MCFLCTASCHHCPSLLSFRNTAGATKSSLHSWLLVSNKNLEYCVLHRKVSPKTAAGTACLRPFLYKTFIGIIENITWNYCHYQLLLKLSRVCFFFLFTSIRNGQSYLILLSEERICLNHRSGNSFLHLLDSLDNLNCCFIFLRVCLSFIYVFTVYLLLEVTLREHCILPLLLPCINFHNSVHSDLRRNLPIWYLWTVFASQNFAFLWDKRAVWLNSFLLHFLL